MKKTLIVCLGLVLMTGLAFANTVDRAPATQQAGIEKKVDLTVGTPMAGKGAGGPDAYGYRWIDSNEPGGPVYNWIEISGTGTALNLTDDGEANIVSPFPVQFYGATATDLRVGNNGGIIFNATTGDIGAANSSLAYNTTQPMRIFPFWDDIDSDTGNVYWEVQGTAPNRRLIVEWYDRPHYSNSAGRCTFEAILYEGSDEILFQYADVNFDSASWNYGISATVGIQGDTVDANNWFLQYSYNTASLQDNFAIKFYIYVPQAGDLALQSIDEPTSTYIEPGLPFSPMATAGNPGTTSVSNFQMVYSISDQSKAVVYEDTVDVAGPLDPGGTYQATFADFTPLAMTEYDVTAYVSAAGDPYAGNDTIHTWFRTFNEMVGNVTDDNNGGVPVEGATITAVGPATYNTTTDVDGNYFFFDMTAGTYTVTASKTGYLNEVITGVTIIDGAQTTLDLSMGYPVLALSPSDSIYVSLPWGGADSTTWQFTVENQGSRDMTYSVSWPELVKGGKALGDTVYNLDLGAICADNQLLGVEYVGGYLWITGGNNGTDPNKLYKVEVATGTLSATYDQSSAAGWGWRDLAYDGTYLYGSDDGTVKQIDPATGLATGVSITGPTNPCRALAYNPLNDHFYTANFGSSIWEFGRDGTVYNTWANTLAIYGMACDPYNPAGPSLWTWSQDGTPQLTATRFDLTTGTYGAETFVGYSADGAGIAGGATFTNELNPAYCMLIGLSQETSDRVSGYEIRMNNVDWLDVTPASGTVPAYGTENLAVTFDAAGLDSFTDWGANVSFVTNAQLAKANAYVPAYMHVLGLTGVTGGPTTPLSYAFGLNANRPNPVNGRTSFSFTLPKAQDYALKVYNITGQAVASFTGKGQAGPNNLTWNTGKAGPGVYFYQLVSGGMSATRKLVIVK